MLECLQLLPRFPRVSQILLTVHSLSVLVVFGVVGIYANPDRVFTIEVTANDEEEVNCCLLDGILNRIRCRGAMFCVAFLAGGFLHVYKDVNTIVPV